MADNMFVNMQNQAREDVINSKRGVNLERSVFPYGSGKITSLNEGALVPVDCFFCMPGDSIDIEWTSYLESLNPFVDRMYSGMKLSIHAYYNKCEHEWKGWKNYATRGRRGNVSSSLPYIDSIDSDIKLLLDGHYIENIHVSPSVPINCYFEVPFSLSNHLVGILNSHFPNQAISSYIGSGDVSLATAYGLGANTQVNRSFRIDGEQYGYLYSGSIFNAIPFAMYQRIYRDYYLNQNLVKDNNLWFPDDEDEFVLPYVGSKVRTLSSVYPLNGNFSLVPNNNKFVSVPAGDFTTKTADGPILTALRYRQWSGDIFTTSVPFLERNGITNLFKTINVGLNSLVLPLSGKVLSYGDFPLTPEASSLASTYTQSVPINPSTGSVRDFFYDGATSLYDRFTTLSWNELQELAASTLWSRRNADAKGDYNSLIRAHYGVDPDSEDRSPRYLGGSIQRLEFNSVLSSVETSTSPLGTKASVASSGGRGSSTHFECPDFGYVMIIASLVPDTFYTQGLRPEFDPLLRGSELPWSEFANLQKQNLLLQRLYYSGNVTYDSRLIGFTERFIDYKYRDNRLSGHFNDYLDSKFRSMTFARYFDGLVMQNFMSIDNEFVTLSPYNCRSDMYSVPSQPHFALQFGDNVRLVRCLPYAAKEATLTNIA